MNIDNDKRFRTMTIESVEERPDGWDVKWSDHWGVLYVTNEHCKQAPSPGETARVYEEGGNVVRGIVIGGRVYRYRPDPEAAPAELKLRAEGFLEAVEVLRAAIQDEAAQERMLVPAAALQRVEYYLTRIGAERGYEL
jgi:hypothetical protein